MDKFNYKIISRIQDTFDEKLTETVFDLYMNGYFAFGGFASYKLAETFLHSLDNFGKIYELKVVEK